MNYTSPYKFFAAASKHPSKGPAALIFAQDQVEYLSKIAHHAKLDFKVIIAFSKSFPQLSQELKPKCLTISQYIDADPYAKKLINQVSAFIPNEWIYYSH